MKLSNYLSKKIVAILAVNHVIAEKEKDLYLYCVDFLFDVIIFNLTILLVGILCRKATIALLILITLSPTKMLAGGAHAPNQLLCSIISYSISFLILFFVDPLSLFSSYLWVILFLVSLVTILLMCPVDTPNKRFLKSQKKKLKIICSIYSFCLSILFFILFLLHCKSLYTTMCLCVIVIAINQGIGIFLNQRRTPNEA